MDQRSVKAGLVAGLLLFGAFLIVNPAPAQAEEMCDNAYQDCRAKLINLIRNEQVGIDVGMWFMDDWRYRGELLSRHRAGVPVRVIMNTRASSTYPGNAETLRIMREGGIPMRDRNTSGGGAIFHYKTMIFAGQNVVEFSAANFSSGSLQPSVPYTDYVDEAIMFTDDLSLVNSFKTKFDDAWVNTSRFTNYANITTPLVRNYPVSPIAAEMSFPPTDNFGARTIAALDAETVGIDVIMFRITDPSPIDALIRAHQRGVRVRLITEPDQYRNPTYYWHSYNVDRLQVAGVTVLQNMKNAPLHQKSVVLHGQQMAIFGSSNWTASSFVNGQYEHNLFTTKPENFTWFVNQFNMKWNSTREDGITAVTLANGKAVYQPLVTKAPVAPTVPSPSTNGTFTGTSVTLSWEGGLWSHMYDIYFGTTVNPPLVASNVLLGSPNAGVRETYVINNLLPATKYYWKIVGKTMASRTATGPVWNFTTTGGAVPPPPPPPVTGIGVIEDSVVRAGSYVGTNYGGVTELISKFSADPVYHREAYLKLDISGVQPGAAVRLRLFGKLSDARAASVVTELFSAGDVAWTESGINWNNKPAADGLLGSMTVSGTTGAWYELDITAYVQAQRLAGQNLATIVLKNPQDTLPYSGFNSTEASASRPMLIGQ